MQIFLFRYPGEGEDQPRPLLYVVRVPRSSHVGDVVNGLAKLSGVPATRLLLTEVYQGQLFQTFGDSQPTSRMKDGDMLVCYETAPATEEEDGDDDDDERDPIVTLVVLHRRLDQQQLLMGIQSPELAGVPCLVTCRASTPCHRCVWLCVWLCVCLWLWLWLWLWRMIAAMRRIVHVGTIACTGSGSWCWPWLLDTPPWNVTPRSSRCVLLPVL